MTESLRIVLIDDNPGDRARAARELARVHQHVRIHEVMTPADLQPILEGESPHVVVTDYQLAWSDGLQVLRAFKERYPDIAVIMFTDSGTVEIAVEAMKLGLHDYIVKSPSHFARLAQAVRAAAEHTRASRRAAAIESAATFLAEASQTLSASLEYEATLEAITLLVVPQLADACSVDLLDEQNILQRVAATGADPACEAVIREIHTRYPPLPTATQGTPRIMRAGKIKLYPDISPQQLAGYAHDDDHFRLLRTLRIRSALIAPLMARGCVLGVLTLLMTDYSGRRFTRDDVLLAEDLARRIAQAVDNVRLYAEAHKAIRIRSQFLGIASHELRTPLTTIKANLQLAELRVQRAMALTETAPVAQQPHSDPSEASDSVGTPHNSVGAIFDQLAPMQGLLDRALRQSDRLERLIADLLDISRIEAGRLEMQRAPVDLITEVRECVEEQRLSWPERTIVINLPTIPVMVCGDVDRIGQVITNFVINALKYSRPHTEVTVSLCRQGDQARIEVRDQGMGIPTHELPHIWDRFYRAAGVQHQSGSGVGLGLGLYISKTIVDRHGGQVGVESVPGEGSTFWCTLPLLHADIQPRGDPESDASTGVPAADL